MLTYIFSFTFILIELLYIILKHFILLNFVLTFISLYIFTSCFQLMVISKICYGMRDLEIHNKMPSFVIRGIPELNVKPTRGDNIHQFY